MQKNSLKPALIVGSANPDKVTELNELLANFFVVKPRPGDMPETIEDGKTLEDNAMKKAIEVYLATYKSALADDTGLFVEALRGAPGVYSARYAGENVTYQDNVDKLLTELSDLKEVELRKAYFETVIALVDIDKNVIIASGRVDGHIGFTCSGTNGFGYDSVFIPTDGDGRTFAEMSPKEKKQYSHRSKAIQDLIKKIS